MMKLKEIKEEKWKKKQRGIKLIKKKQKKKLHCSYNDVFALLQKN
jgi:hypothetical protein